MVLGQSHNLALHTISSILELEKSLALLNDNIRSGELQLMRNDCTYSSDVLQQLEGSRARYDQIIDSLHRKRAALGVDKRVHLTLLHQTIFFGFA